MVEVYRIDYSSKSSCIIRKHQQLQQIAHQRSSGQATTLVPSSQSTSTRTQDRAGRNTKHANYVTALLVQVGPTTVGREPRLLLLLLTLSYVRTHCCTPHRVQPVRYHHRKRLRVRVHLTNYRQTFSSLYKLQQRL